MWTCCRVIRSTKTALVMTGFCPQFVLNCRTSGGHKDMATAGTWRGSDCRYKVLQPPLSVKSTRGQPRWSSEMDRMPRRHGDGTMADNWAWDSVATKQHGLSNEINDVVLGLVSPRRGLSPNSPPKVKERTITQTQIHQAHSQSELKMMFQSWVRAHSCRKKKQFTQKLRSEH